MSNNVLRGFNTSTSPAASAAYNFQDSLPTVVVGNAGDQIELADILRQSFGSSRPAGFSSYTLTDLNQNLPNLTGNETETSYWATGAAAQDSYWLLDGQRVPSGQTIGADDINHVTMVIGNSMLNTTSFTVSTSGAQANLPLSRTYNVWTAQPNVASSQIGNGDVTSNDMVASANLFNQLHYGLANQNNCNWIADDVAAAAGASMPYLNDADAPEQNVSGGFWRAVYRGDETAAAASNWSTLTQPGDVIRMVWTIDGGHHTTTVVGSAGNGELTFFDNDLPAGNETAVGEHPDNYWLRTDPDSITIYRLDLGGQYLIEGTGNDEILQGTVYNDLVHTAGSAPTVMGGLGDDEIQTDSKYGAGGLLLGNEGNDSIFVRNDNTTVSGGQGDDVVTSYLGSNLLYGNGGADTITALVGDNTIVGGPGRLDGADLIKGGSGDDLILGNGGNDTLSGGAGLDTVLGGFGADVLLANAGDDLILGNAGDDIIYGGKGNDTVYGGKGDDIIMGGNGNDLLFGGIGDNLFSFAAGDTTGTASDGMDTVGDFKSGTDHVHFTGGSGGTPANFGSTSSTSSDYSVVQSLAQSILSGGKAYAFVGDGTDGFLFTTAGNGGGASIGEVVRLAGVTQMQASDIQ